jgi:predicted HD phosphohydrolase
MKDEQEFKQIAKTKIKGWYSTQELEDKAVARMATQRKEIINLLLSTRREGISEVVQYLDDSGFFYRASSPNGHHNFPGGLAEHALGTYQLAKISGAGLPSDSVIICALLHDICKSDRFWFKGRTIRQHTPKCELDSKHSVRSIAILDNCGLKLSESERRAIRWHMKGPHYHSRVKRKELDHAKAVKEDLWRVVFWADKNDAAAHPGKRH